MNTLACKNPNFEIKSKVGGRVQIRIVGEDGKDRYNGPVFDNLLTDFGMNYVVGNSSWDVATSYCGVGTSSTTPQYTDIALGAQVGNRTSSLLGGATSVNSGSPNYIHSLTRTFAFAQGAIVGNIAEVGFSQTNVSSLCSRALIKDGAGNPTTLTVLSTDTLYITYELRHIPLLTDTSGTHTISGVGYAYVQRARHPGTTSTCLNTTITGSMMAYETQTLPAFGSSPSSGSSSGSVVALAYTTGTFYRDYQWVFSPTQGNFGTGIGILGFGYGSASSSGFYVSYTPTKIPKLSTQTLTVVMRVSQARI